MKKIFKMLAGTGFVSAFAALGYLLLGIWGLDVSMDVFAKWVCTSIFVFAVSGLMFIFLNTK